MLRKIPWLLLTLFVLVTTAFAVPVFKANDRIVVYGDSITEQRMYSRYLQQYLYVRYPEMKLQVYNAGWGGDQASGALNRLERDVLYLKPNVVTLFFGMNDGHYQAIADATMETYRKNMEGIITALQAKGVRVVVFTPGAVDYDRQPKLKDCDYNKTLEGLGKVAIELAKKYQCAYADIHQPMVDYQTARKAENPAYCMIPDSVHPNSNGHLVMAYYMLQGMGAEAMPPLGTVDLHANTATGLRIVTNTAESVVLETIAPALTPFWFENASLDTMKKSGFLAMAGQKITLSGLPDGVYEAKVNGVVYGLITAKELADGYLFPGNLSVRGHLLHDLTMRKENNYFSAWREIRLPLQALDATKNIMTGLMAADDGFHAAIWEQATPEKLTFTLTPQPAGKQ